MSRQRSREIRRLPERGILNGMEIHMGLGMILLIVLIVMMIGVVPAWPHSSGWGYYPSGGIGLVLLVVIVLLVMGRI